MTRNLVHPETAERNREISGTLTFNAEIADDYEGRIFIFATLRIGDHAHVDAYSGRQNALKDGELRPPTRHFGHAGRLIFAWRDWEALRDQLEVLPNFLIREVERPTQKQLETKV